MIELGLNTAAETVEVGDIIAYVGNEKKQAGKTVTLLPLTEEKTYYCDWDGYRSNPYTGLMFRELGKKMGADRLKESGNTSANAPTTDYLLGTLKELYYLDFTDGGGSKKSSNGGVSWNAWAVTLPAGTPRYFSKNKAAFDYLVFGIDAEANGQYRLYLVTQSGTVTVGRYANPAELTLVDAACSPHNSMGYILTTDGTIYHVKFTSFMWTDSDTYLDYTLNVPIGDWYGIEPLSGSVSEGCVLYNGEGVAFPAAVSQVDQNVTVTWKTYSISELGGSEGEYIVSVMEPTGSMNGNVYVATNKRVLLFKKAGGYVNFTQLSGTTEFSGDIVNYVPDAYYGVDIVHTADADGTQHIYYMVLRSRSEEYPATIVWSEITPLGDVWGSLQPLALTLTNTTTPNVSRQVPGVVLQDGTVWKCTSSKLDGQPAFPFNVPAYPGPNPYAKLVAKIE